MKNEEYVLPSKPMIITLLNDAFDEKIKIIIIHNSSSFEIDD
jgi:hypothetical protein